MKKSKSQELLEQAIRLLPKEREYVNANTYLRKAITEVMQADTKREKRLRNAQAQLTPQEQWKMDLATNTLYNPNSKVILDGIVRTLDDMIQKEREKLEQIRKKPIEEKQPDDENMGTILG